MLGKRAGELDEFWVKLFGHPMSPPDPELLRDLLAAHPPSSLKPSGPADEPIDVEQQPPPIPEEPSLVSSPDHAPLSPSDELNKVWQGLYGHSFFEKPLPSIHEEPSPVSSLNHAPPSPGDELNNLWRNFFMGLPESHFLLEPEELPATHPSEPSQVASPGYASLSPDDELNKVWLELFGHQFFEKSSASRPSWASSPSEPVHGWTDIEPPPPFIPEEPPPVSNLGHVPASPGLLMESGYELVNWDAPRWQSGPVSSTMSSADHGLMGAHALPNSGPSTEPSH